MLHDEPDIDKQLKELQALRDIVSEQIEVLDSGIETINDNIDNNIKKNENKLENFIDLSNSKHSLFHQKEGSKNKTTNEKKSCVCFCIIT